MPNLKISELDPVAPLDGTELTVLVQSAGNVKATLADLISYHTDQENPHPQYITAVSPGGNALISGGGVVATGNLDITISAALYMIQGTFYTAPQTDITLSTADATHPRIDLVVADTNGDFVIIEGTPSANPVKPELDPGSQLEISFILVPAGATSLVFTNELIYLESAEWTDTASGAEFDLASTNFPFSGTIDIEATGAGNGDYVNFADSGDNNLAAYNNLVLYIRSKAAWPAQKSFQVRWLDASGVQVGNIVTIDDGTFGFTSTVTGSYQQVVIPVELFQTNSNSVRQLRMTVIGGGATIGFYLDNIFLQSGVALTNPSSQDRLRWASPWVAERLYHINDVVSYDKGLYVAVVDNVNATPSSSSVYWALMVEDELDEEWCGFIETPDDRDYTIILNTRFAGEITQVTTQSESGTCTMAVEINGTPLGGTANSVSTSEQSQNHASTNDFVAGDNVGLAVSSNSSCEGLSFSIRWRRA
jgi:hypothetical protein